MNGNSATAANGNGNGGNGANGYGNGSAPLPPRREGANGPGPRNGEPVGPPVGGPLRRS